MKTEVDSVVALPAPEAQSADVALLRVEPTDFSRTRFVGHLNRFEAGLRVVCTVRSGRTVHGRLVREGWSGRMMYSFGVRRLTDQWIVAIQPATARAIKRGDSGSVWATSSGVVIGLQVGILSGDAGRAIVTPFQTLEELLGVRVAA